MKKNIIIIAMSLCWACMAEAQDVIAHRDGDVTMGKIVEVTKEEVKYRKQDNPEGPLYVLKVDDLLSICYANGSQDIFSRTEDEEDSRYVESETAVYQFRPEIRMHFDAPLTDNVDGGTGLQFVAGIQVAPSFICGPGVGLQTRTYNCLNRKNGGVNEEPYSVDCPIFLQGRYFMPNKKMSPYLLGQVGYAFGRLHDHSEVLRDGESDRLGAFYALGVGCKVKLRRGSIFIDFTANRQHLRNDVMDTPACFCISGGYFFERRR